MKPRSGEVIHLLPTLPHYARSCGVNDNHAVPRLRNRFFIFQPKILSESVSSKAACGVIKQPRSVCLTAVATCHDTAIGFQSHRLTPYRQLRRYKQLWGGIYEKSRGESSAFCCLGKTRTLTNGTRIRCATITPQGNF